MTTVEEQEARLARSERRIQEGSIRPVFLRSVKVGLYCATCRQTLGVHYPKDPGGDVRKELFDDAEEHALQEHLYELRPDDLCFLYLQPLDQWLATFGPGREQTAYHVAGPEPPD